MTIKETIEALWKRAGVTFREIDEHRCEVYVDNEYFGVWDSEREAPVDEKEEL